MKGGTNVQGFFVQTAHRILLLLPVPSLLLQCDDQLFFKPKRCHIFLKNCKLFFEIEFVKWGHPFSDLLRVSVT